MPRNGGGVAENPQVHCAVAAAGDDPALELLDEAVHGLRPDRVSHHDIAGAGREAARFERFRKGPPEFNQVAFGHLDSEKQAVVLIGPDGLLAAPLGAHHEKAAILLDGGRRS